MSYIKNLILSASHICHEGSDLWLAQVSLHCFSIVEMHCLDQVMQQFGLSWHISDYIDTGDEQHNISRQGKHEVNWLVIHASYLDI
jgi:hypothetical protein